MNNRYIRRRKCGEYACAECLGDARRTAEKADGGPRALAHQHFAILTSVEVAGHYHWHMEKPTEHEIAKVMEGGWIGDGGLAVDN